MTTITPKEASSLSYLARYGSVTKARKRRIEASLKGEALAVAKALMGSRSSRRAQRSARTLRKLTKNGFVASSKKRR